MVKGIQKIDIQQDDTTISSYRSTNELSVLLPGLQYSVLLEKFHQDGIFTIEQYRQKFKRNGLMRYLNGHDLYTWQERVKVVEAVHSLLSGLDPESTQPTLSPLNPTLIKPDCGTIVDFDSNGDYHYTFPIKVVFGGIDQAVNNWTDFLVQFCEYMVSYHPAEMLSLIHCPLFPGSSRPYVMPEKVSGLASKKLTNGTWIVTHYNATKIVQIAKAICLRCNHPLSDIVVFYERIHKRRAERFSRKLREKPERIYKAPKTPIEISKEQLEAYILSRGLSGCSIDEMIAGTNQPSQMTAAIMRSIEANDHIVEINPGRYIHRSCIVDINEAAEELRNILRAQFVQFDGYSNNRLLFDAARINLSLFMNDNAFEDDMTIYNLAKYLFSKEEFGGNRFIFYGNSYIWEIEPDYPQSMKGLLIHQARLAGGKITRTECETYLDKIKMGRGNFNQAVLNTEDSTFYQYATGEYLLSESLKIDEEWQAQIKKLLDEIFDNNDFVIPRDISEIWFEKLPELPMSLQWTPLLLQEVLYYNSDIGYKTISAPINQNKNTIAAAIVPSNSAFTTLSDVVSAYLRNVIDLPKRFEAEDLRLLLRKVGMIDGNELIYNMHKALNDYRFAWSNENRTVFIIGE